MLAGELPWSEASTESEDWNAWIDKNPELESRTPWTKIDLDSLVFIRKILQAKSHKRLTIEKLLNHRWMDEDTQTFKSQNLNNISKRLLHSRLKDANRENVENIEPESHTASPTKRVK